MEQPRFGGVASPPLSVPQGEGMSRHFVADTMDPTNDLHNVGREDPEVQTVMEVLHQLGISPQLERHRLKQERQHEAEAEATDDSGVYCKNLLLKDRKGQAYLIVCGENDRADLRVVRHHINVQGNLHFASKWSLWSLLRVKPGAVSPLALVHSSGNVRMFVDDSLVKSIDRDSTKLYFHPMRNDLQVGLTLAQLERFISYCGVILETLPSLTSYTVRRRYTNLSGGYNYKHKFGESAKKVLVVEKTSAGTDLPQQTTEESAMAQTEESAMAQTEESAMAQTEESRMAQTEESVMAQTEKNRMAQTEESRMAQTENSFTQHLDFFQGLGVNVETVPRERSEGLLNCTTLPCKSLHLKDKRNNYFLFISHENQKVDFSSLKMQLKPRKKIEPLAEEELWSLLHLHENQQHPFALAQLQQPHFLVAICDNLCSQDNVFLTFPHPTDSNLNLQTTLKHLEIFFKNTSHDFTTVRMKGNIKEMQAISAHSSSFKTPKVNHQPQALDAEDDFHTHEPVHKRQSHFSKDQETVPASRPAGQSSNLFYRLTAPLRQWILSFIGKVVRLLDHYLPDRIMTLLRRSLLWNRMLTSGDNTTERKTDQREDEANESECGEKHKLEKIARHHHLIEQSGIQVGLTELEPLARFLKDDVERCKTFLLEDGHGQPYIMLCIEDDDPRVRSLRRLRTVFRSRSSLHPVSDENMPHHLPWQGQSSASWTTEDLNPVVLMDMVFHTEKRVKVGMAPELYSFPDTLLKFDLPSLGITLQLGNDDLEKMLRQSGFCVVYLS